MNRRHSYKNKDLARETIRKQKKRYYSKTAIYGWQKWTVEQDKMVLEHKMTDTELSSIIHHSVQAIQNRRSILKNNK